MIKDLIAAWGTAWAPICWVLGKNALIAFDAEQAKYNAYYQRRTSDSPMPTFIGLPILSNDWVPSSRVELHYRDAKGTHQVVVLKA